MTIHIKYIWFRETNCELQENVMSELWKWFEVISSINNPDDDRNTQYLARPLTVLLHIYYI
jgi:hypothetical protein